MQLVQVTAPLAPASDTDALAAAVTHLRLHSDTSDADAQAEVEPYLAAAVARMDGRHGLLGRALVTQEWRLELDAFPAAITLPLPPLQSVDSVTYVDPEGATQSLTTHRTFGTDPALVLPAYGEDFPDTKDQPNAVEVAFTAGYGDVHADMPTNLWHALLLDAAHLYENRESTLVGVQAASLPMGYSTLVADYRVWSF